MFWLFSGAQMSSAPDERGSQSVHGHALFSDIDNFSALGHVSQTDTEDVRTSRSAEFGLALSVGSSGCMLQIHPWTPTGLGFDSLAKSPFCQKPARCCLGITH